MEKRRKTVFVGMSGGVDSSVAAALLKQATPNNFEKLFGRPTPKGFREYEVVGIHLKCWNVDGCAEQDAEDARRAAEALGIPFYVLDFEEEYKKRVVEYMVAGYRAGVTPNPDVECNREIKFGLFLEKALEMGADFVATGHYVRLRRKSQKSNLKNQNFGYSLYQAKDLNKDQSYFLWTLTQEQLAHCLFPIGDYLKPQVRVLARKFGLPNAEKKDSQGICFLGKVALPDFLKNYIPARRGAVVTTSGEKIGEHKGAAFYTIGQRHIGVQYQISNIKNQKRGNDQKPFYVAEKNIKTNTLTVAEGDDNPALFRKEVMLTQVNFIKPLATSHLPLEVFARVRYRQPLAAATLIAADIKPINAKSNPRFSAMVSASFRLRFNEAQKFIAPGQSAVFYVKEGNYSRSSGRHSREFRMLGGGIIE